jgi:acyl-coenzyme A synthetase/AMP-(fatty) acid ligase
VHGRLYRTGDWVRRRTDRQLTFLGRLDRQVKLRGHRIELGEVELAAETHPAVDRAAAVVVEERAGPALALLVQLRPGAAAEATELRAHLAGTIPFAMLPQRLSIVDQLPRTGNGGTLLRHREVAGGVGRRRRRRLPGCGGPPQVR